MIYFRTTDIIDLKLWTKHEIHVAWYAVFKDMHNSIFPWVGYVLCISIPIVIAIIDSSLPNVLLTIPGLLVGIFIMSQFQLYAAKPLMLKWLEQHYPNIP